MRFLYYKEMSSLLRVFSNELHWFTNKLQSFESLIICETILQHKLKMQPDPSNTQNFLYWLSSCLSNQNNKNCTATSRLWNCKDIQHEPQKKKNASSQCQTAHPLAGNCTSMWQTELTRHGELANVISLSVNCKREFQNAQHKNCTARAVRYTHVFVFYRRRLPADAAAGVVLTGRRNWRSGALHMGGSRPAVCGSSSPVAATACNQNHTTLGFTPNCTSTGTPCKLNSKNT